MDTLIIILAAAWGVTLLAAGLDHWKHNRKRK